MKRSRSILICLACALTLGAAARADNSSTPAGPTGMDAQQQNALRQKTVMANKLMLLQKLREHNRPAHVTSFSGGSSMMPMPAAASPAQPAHSVPADNTLSGNPYGSIVTRNVFGLNPPPPPDVTPPGPPPPKITLTGITTIFGPKEALYKVAGVPRPGAPPKDESYMLAEGESQDDVTVKRIDVDKGIVTFINHEVVQDVPLVAGVASGGGSIGGGNSGGFQPPRFGGFRGGPAGFNNNPQNFRPRFGQPGGYGGNQTPLTGEDQQALIAAQRAQMEQAGNPIANLMPPTKFDDQARQELGGSPGGGNPGTPPAPVP